VIVIVARMLLVVIAAIATFGCSLLYCARQAYTLVVFSQISKSHIQGNEPSRDDFDVFMQRDLTAYFAKDYPKGTVAYEMLRKGATQVGVSYPKYYVWVTLYENGELCQEGAVSLAAIEQERFDIRAFVSAQEMLNDFEKVHELFPKAVCETIRQRLNLPDAEEANQLGE